MSRRLLLAVILASLAGNAQAFYPEWVPKSEVPFWEVRRMHTADFNGDGRADIVGYNSQHQVRVLLAQNDGTLGPAVQIHVGDYIGDTAVGDMTGDGKADVIVADIGTNTLVVLPSNGDGTFGAPITNPLPVAPSEITAGDFDGDGKTDIALRSYSAVVVAVYKGDGAGHFAEASSYPTGAPSYQIASGDIDNDGHRDVVIAKNAPRQYEIYFGNGDGTLDPPLVVAGPPTFSSRIVVADLDADGDLELLSCEFNSNTVSVVVNLGGRSFASMVSYTVPHAYDYGDPYDLVVGEVTGDGHADVVVALANSKVLATLPGLGNGTLAIAELASVPQPEYGYYDYAFPERLVAGDFTGDGRLDIAVSTYSSYIDSVVLFANASGDATVSVQSQYPTITAGQTTTLSVSVRTATGFLYPYSYQPAFPTGHVVIKDGATVLGTITLQNRTGSLEVTSLSLGQHSITASFEGDSSYHPAESAAISQNVVSERTIVTLTSNGAGTEIPYGQQFLLQGAVTSEIPGPLEGYLYLYTDGVRSQYASGLNYSQWINGLPPGTHTLYLQYEGSPTQPPSKSNVVTQVIKKDASSTTIFNLTTHAWYGAQPQVIVDLRGNHGGTPGGNVHLYDGTTLLLTTFADNKYHSGGMSVYFDMPVLAAGVHYIRAVYEGDAYHEPSESTPKRFTVVPNTGFFLDVLTSTSGTPEIFASGWYSGLPSGGYYVIERRIGSGSWIVVDSHSSYPSDSEWNPPAGIVYAYRMHAYASGGQLLASSNVDMAMVTTFTDEPLRVTVTPVKAQHLTELISVTNALRASAGLSAIGTTGIAPGQPVRASHLAAIFTAMNEGRAAFGAAPLAVPAELAAGGTIRANHLQQLRDAIH